MKLVEILAKKLDVWPTGAAIAVQDGDARKTVKFGSKHANPSIALMGVKDVWQARDWKYTYQSDFDHSVLASDWKTAIVTHDQWKAERDRQKGGEWKRHRGGKQPVADDVAVEYKLRNGYTDTWHARALSWSHAGGEGDVMKYRVISQPQAEEVEVSEPELTYTLNWIEVDERNPLKWRDTIIHCQAIIEDCEREIQRNVDLLDAEGLMMQTDSKKAMQHYEEHATIPFSEWQIGDIVEVISLETFCDPSVRVGGQVPIIAIDKRDDTVKVADGTWGDEDNYKFIRRP